jgi:hypothetical protein
MAQHNHFLFVCLPQSYTVTADTVVAVVAAGRRRWKIENENNNTLKTKGYHFEHNDGHGKQHLSAAPATLIILAYLAHTVVDCLDQRYRAVRAQLPSRQTFFVWHYIAADEPRDQLNLRVN